MPVKPIPPDEPDKAKPIVKRVSQSDEDRPRVIPYRWHDEEDGSKTVPPGRSNRNKGEWMKR
jgi:hypothetical protein